MENLRCSSSPLFGIGCIFDVLIGESRSTGGTVVNTTYVLSARDGHPHSTAITTVRVSEGNREKKKKKESKARYGPEKKNLLVGTSGLFLPRQMPERETGEKE